MAIEQEFTVIIVGGGIKYRVGYLLLERRHNLDGLEGAAVSIAPNGARILDQLGVLTSLQKHTQICHYICERDEDGGMVSPKSDSMQLWGEARWMSKEIFSNLCSNISSSGYPVEFCERQRLQMELLDNLEDKNKITVSCQDGSAYNGDIVAGADGVSSITRSEIWRHMVSNDPSLPDDERNGTTISFRCLFGLSVSAPGLEYGDLDLGYAEGRSSFLMTGPGNKTAYCFYEKLENPHRCVLDPVPYYDQCEAQEFAQSAAALANNIHLLVHGRGGRQPTEDEIQKSLRMYQDKRKQRIIKITNASSELGHVQLRGVPSRSFLPISSIDTINDAGANDMSEYVIGAECLEYLRFQRYQCRAACRSTQNKIFAYTISERLLKAWKSDCLIPASNDRDRDSYSQPLVFLTDYGIILAVWSLESTRRSNISTPAQ
ncbi:hypothetical protein K505DRAFT_337579 [Melanomma pulvis-pyrius CBS 109.77]|uniref:FAD/NAD(P)-binding domain-containing protein n=1 Tax=Melanomma pulvis-pyrius CBS 109.77 TaxID=1314802 RepID=A0A6A6XCH7_9PLEO|nr:hypothetical protein K505DRAFT_337579 [Melanomma pulvis-pyrius CBS 109.77]